MTQAGLFRIGSGTCEDYRNRAKTAILSLRDKYIFWPDEEDRCQLAKSNEEKYHCPNAILYGDGTLHELMLAPQTPDRGDYHGRKMQWSLTTLILGDDECRVRYYLSGFPGCSHDNRVWRWSKIYKEKEKYFSPLQYVIMDTAFEPSDVCVPTYKKQPVPDPDKEKFNTTVAKYRVKSEHLNGISKGRFPGALRRIRKVITKDIKSLEEILSYIECAFILHNMLIDLRDADDGEELENEWMGLWMKSTLILMIQIEVIQMQRTILLLSYRQ